MFAAGLEPTIDPGLPARSSGAVGSILALFRRHPAAFDALAIGRAGDRTPDLLEARFRAAGHPRTFVAWFRDDGPFDLELMRRLVFSRPTEAMRPIAWEGPT